MTNETQRILAYYVEIFVIMENWTLKYMDSVKRNHKREENGDEIEN